MNLITVNFDSNQSVKVEKGTTYLNISRNSKLKDTVLGVKKNNEILSLNDKAMQNETVEFFDCL